MLCERTLREAPSHAHSLSELPSAGLFKRSSWLEGAKQDWIAGARAHGWGRSHTCLGGALSPEQAAERQPCGEHLGRRHEECQGHLWAGRAARPWLTAQQDAEMTWSAGAHAPLVSCEGVSPHLCVTRLSHSHRCLRSVPATLHLCLLAKHLLAIPPVRTTDQKAAGEAGIS